MLQEALNVAKDAHISLQEQNFNLQSQQSHNLKEQMKSNISHEPTLEDLNTIKRLQIEVQKQRNIVLEQEAQIETMKETTLLGESQFGSKIQDTEQSLKLEEIESDLGTLKVKNRFLEEKIQQLEQTNIFLDDKLLSFQQNNTEIIEENIAIKKQVIDFSMAMEELQRDIEILKEDQYEKAQNQEFRLSKIDGFMDEKSMLKDENSRLIESLAGLKKKMNTLVMDNRSLRDHVNTYA